jgi:hypothetical protein
MPIKTTIKAMRSSRQEQKNKDKERSQERKKKKKKKQDVKHWLLSHTSQDPYKYDMNLALKIYINVTAESGKSKRKRIKMGNPHILAIPYPAQGHVLPLMEFSQRLVIKHGFMVTFVNTEYIHKRVVNALAEKNHLGDQIHLVSIPDGLDPWEDRTDLGKLCEAIFRVMPRKLEELIEDINRSEGDHITCVVTDISMGWALEVAEKMKIPRAAFCPASSATLASIFNIPKLIDSGIINSDGEISCPYLTLTIQHHQ